MLAEFPNSSIEPFEITSPETEEYNCIAWVLDNRSIWIEPDDSTTWLQNIPNDYLLPSVVKYFEKQGFEICQKIDYSKDKTLLALFSKDGIEFSHVAKQLNENYWTRKLGFSFDVKHTIFAMEGGCMGVLRFL